MCRAAALGASLEAALARLETALAEAAALQSPSFTGFLDGNDIDGLVICGVELVCCVLYAVLGAAERGYHYMVPRDLVSGQDPGDQAGNKAVRDYLRFNHPEHVLDSSEEILRRWRARAGQR